MYVVSGHKTNLLGLPVITALNLASRVHATTETPSVTQMYPSIVQGLENLDEQYTIKSSQEQHRTLLSPNGKFC